jgi:F0F1-type ATP synthase membrane subunit b/b'
MDLDQMVEDANKRLEKQLNEDVAKAKEEITASCEAAAKRLGVVKEFHEARVDLNGL